MRDRAAFELSHCSTCRFLFRRIDAVSDGLSADELTERLAAGLSDLDGEVIDRFASILPADHYLPILMEVSPRLVFPGQAGDYFAHEQMATWGGPVETPRTPYYRTFDAPLDPASHLFEFVVPMVSPQRNDPARVVEFQTRLHSSSAPTAVAVSVLYVCQPANGGGPDRIEHWTLTHFLLDGHHKVEAAARSARSVRLLSLLSVSNSIATPQQVTAIPSLRSR